MSSNNNDPGIITNEESPGRPRRNIRHSQRAQEILDTGESLPGIPSPRQIPPLLALPSAGDRSFLQPSPSALGTTAAIMDRDKRTGTNTMPTFGPEKLMIYDWPLPRPKSLLNHWDHRRAWKIRRDKQEKAGDIDDRSDDWYNFCGSRELYEDVRKDGFALEWCVANTFVHRAKRAFWAGKSRHEFEMQEQSINSEAQARAEADPSKKSRLMEYALDNNLRLAVFNALKRRLSEEIWLEPCESPPAMRRSDSKASKPSVAISSSGPTIVGRRAPTAEEMERGITSWSIDSFGVEQPFYGDERELGGMQNFMQDMRELVLERD